MTLSAFKLVCLYYSYIMLNVIIGMVVLKSTIFVAVFDFFYFIFVSLFLLLCLFLLFEHFISSLCTPILSPLYVLLILLLNKLLVVTQSLWYTFFIQNLSANAFFSLHMKCKALTIVYSQLIPRILWALVGITCTSHMLWTHKKLLLFFL